LLRPIEMKYTLIVLVAILALVSARCRKSTVVVKDESSFKSALASAKPGMEIVVNGLGICADEGFELTASGEKDCPITITGNFDPMYGSLCGTLYVNGSSYVEISNLVFEFGQIGLYVVEGNSITVENVKFSDMSKTGMILEKSKDITARNCSFWNAERYPRPTTVTIDAVVVSGSTQCTFDSCSFGDGLNRTGIKFDNSADNTVQRCFFDTSIEEGFGGWIVFNNGSSGNKVDGNYFTQMREGYIHSGFRTGITCDNSPNNIFMNNMMYVEEYKVGIQSFNGKQKICSSNIAFGQGRFTSEEIVDC